MIDSFFELNMFLRSIFIPSLVVCVIAAPFLFSKAGKVTNQAGLQTQNSNGWGSQDLRNLSPAPLNQNTRQTNPFRQASSSFQNAPNGNPIFHQASARGYASTNPAALSAPTIPTNHPIRQPTYAGVPTPGTQVGFSQPNFVGMTPDYGAVETIVLPGNAFGPDLNAAPLEFMPVTNFEEIFRFNLSPSWVKNRWKRVSTSPGDLGLHGLRVALVTGTNSWDLHGSLTYYFDSSQRIQRITFRGWAGDATKLVSLLTHRYEFKPQQTHWAGFYLAGTKRKSTGGILMQHPAVIYTENPVQQIAVVLEMNNPQSQFELSNDFRSLIIGSQQSQ